VSYTEGAELLWIKFKLGTFMPHLPVRDFLNVETTLPGAARHSFPDTFAGKDEIAAGIQKATLLNRSATLADVGNVAAFVASDQARTMTATDVNISCGALMD
jgi:hypothetical protein